MTSVVDDILLPYQRAWVRDLSRYKVGLWSRQTGKSFATACEAVLDCMVRPGQLWVCMSAGERQAMEWLRKARQWSDAVELVISGYEEISDAADARRSKAEITYANGSRILAIPANPDTARGYSANLVLDEFASHEDSWGIWAAIYPSITSPMSGTKRLRIVSTPKGLGNKFADIWAKPGLYSRHKVTIEDAVAAGLQVDIDELRAGVDDADIWAQEYICEFLDASGVLLPYEMIAGCVASADVFAALPPDAPRYIGMDIGRARDLSVIVTAAEVGGLLYVESVRTLERMPFAEQLQELCSAARPAAIHRVCIDATGIGAMLAEEARRLCGGKVEPVQFTAASKGKMYQGMRRRFEEKTVRIPSSRVAPHAGA